MKRIAFYLIFAFVFAVPLHAKESQQGPVIKQYEFENGLQLIVIPDRRAPVVTHMVWYKVGAADDPPGKSGLAHYVEHLMFKATKNHEQGEFSSAIAEIGGQENAFTSADYTAYYQKVSPDALPRMMAFEADRMRNIVLSEAVVQPEREVILEERSSRVDSSPGVILSEFVNTALFVHHPYGTPIIGWEHEIEKLSLDDIYTFYERWYQPWNAIVVIAGDVEPEDVRKLVENTYGKIEASQPAAARERFSEPPKTVKRELEYADRRVTNPSWQRQFVVPSYRTAQNNDAAALELLAAIMGGTSTSRIRQSIVLGDEIATSAGAWYDGSLRDFGTFGFYASPRGDVSLSEIQTALEAQVDMLLEDGVTQEELEKARNIYLKSTIFSRDSQVTMARIMGSILTTGGSVEDYIEWPERLKSVTVEDVNRVAKTYLNRSVAVTSRLLPETGAMQ